MNTAAAFTWTGGLPADAAVGADPATRVSADFGEQWTYQATGPIAAALRSTVQRLGSAAEVAAPVFGEGAWAFAFRVGGRQYVVTVQWVGRGGRDDSFAADVSPRRGWFGPRLAPAAAEPGLAVLRGALAACPKVADVVWVERAWE